MKLLYIVVLVATLKYAEAACYNGSIEACTACGGSCETTQCFCINGITPCVPTAGECYSESNSCCPTGYYYDKTDACCTDVVLCNPSCSDDEICRNGTCVCNTTFHKGKTINDLKPSVLCESDVMTISISRCLLTYLKYNYEALQFANNSTKCTPDTYNTIENRIRIENIQAELTSGWCGNIITNDSEKIYFSNTLHIDILQSPLITVNPLSFNFTCAYNLTMKLSLNLPLHPNIGITSLPGINGTGSYPLTMAAYWDDKYSDPIEEGEIITVGQDFFLGLFVNNADGKLLALRVDKCVASPTNRSESATVTLVTGGCSVAGDVSTKVEENGESLEARIRVSAFKFQSAEFVYIFCDVRMCDKSTDCKKCDNTKSGQSSSNTREVMLQLAYENYFSSSSATHSALPWVILCSTLLGFLSVKLY